MVLAEKKKLSKDQIAYDEAHGDLQALKAAGVPIPRAVQLAHAHGVVHPAIGKGKQKITSDSGKNPSPGFSQAVKGKNAGVPVAADPTDPAQYAANTLVMAGLPNTASNEALLERQIQEEGVPGSEDNPLATTQKEPGSSAVSGNSAGVQEYPDLEEGAYAEAQTLKEPGFSSLYQALLGGTDTPQQYAQALENSNYEGLGGSKDPANVAYGQAYLGDSPASSFASGSTPIATDTALDGTAALSQAMGTNSFSNVGSATIPQLGSTGANQSLQSALAGLSSSPESQTLAANTSDAPGSPDQTNSQTQQTSVPTSAQYQQALAALLPNIRPGTVK